jgi:Zn-dependent peptidase ImmA (M78 family)
MIAAAIADLRARVGLPADATRRGPVPLDRFFQELNLSHVALPRLTLGGVVDHLRADGVPVEDIGEPTTTLAGFLFAAGRIGVAFVNANDILGRRRFTAAHELGHAVLHREMMGSFIADTDITEVDDTTAGIEREANHFAVELLMPEEVIRARAAELRTEYRACPRLVLAYRLASELLVSREAMRYRLKTLGVGDDD